MMRALNNGRPRVLDANGNPAEAFKHDAMARLHGRVAPVIAAAKAAGVSVEDAFTAYVLAVAGQNPRLARLTLDAIEATIVKLAAERPAEPAPSGKGNAIVSPATVLREVNAAVRVAGPTEPGPGDA